MVVKYLGFACENMGAWQKPVMGYNGSLYSCGALDHYLAI
jgi:hypothetical protein